MSEENATRPEMSVSDHVMIEMDDVPVIKGGNHVQFKRGDLASGIYLYRLTWPGASETQKLVIVD